MIENSHIRLVSPIGSLYREEGEGEEGREEGEGEEGSEIRQLSTSSPAAGVRKLTWRKTTVNSTMCT